jgi:nucleoside-diphosphate-sugar epimerase
MSGVTVVTGGDGYVGSLVAGHLLAGTDDRIVLTVRAADRHERRAKEARLRRRFAVDPRRLRVVAADLREADPFGEIDAAEVTTILHTAAAVQFNVERAVARRVNVEGTAKACVLARRCPRLERFALASSIYSSGRRAGVIAETGHAEPGDFANHYERSKAAAEREVARLAGEVPTTILRLATVVADDDGGSVTQRNAFHTTLRLYFYGLLSVVPGDPGTPLYLVTGDLVATAVTRLLEPHQPPGVYHVSPDRSQCATLGDVLDVAFDVFESTDSYRRRKLLRPLWCDRSTYGALVEGVAGLQAGCLHQALGSVTPFAEQLYVRKDVRNDRLRAAVPDLRFPDPLGLVEATCTHLVATRWGRLDEVAS